MQVIGRSLPATLACFVLLSAAPAWSQQQGIPSRAPADGGPVGAPTGGPAAPVVQGDSVPKVWIRPGPEAMLSEVTLSNPYENDRKAAQEGKRLYQWFNCVGCHAPEGGGGMGPPLSDDEWIYGDEPLSMFKSIWEGRPEGMPTFAGMIPEEQIWKIIAYLQTLQDPSSPAGE